jgi:formate dehydrogenase major subunit
MFNINAIGKEYDFAEKNIKVDNDLGFLKGLAKALLEMGKAPNAEGLDDLKAALKGVKVSKQAEEIAEIYAKAKKAMIVFTQNAVSEDAAVMIANIAVLSGHIGKARDGILQVKSKNNSQGLIDLGVTEGKEALADVKALLVFGEDTDADLSGLEFLMVSDTHMTETAKKANVLIPGVGFASSCGTFTNTERRLQAVNQAVAEEVVYNNWQVAAELAHVFEVEMPYDDIDDIIMEMEEVLPGYQDAEIGDIIGGVLCQNGGFTLTPTDGNVFADALPTTDSLMRKIDALLPKPVK